MNTLTTDQPIETEELVNSFKYKYEELKYIFDLKIKEMQITENNYIDILKKLQLKLDELEDLNSQLKNLVITKENENAQLNQTISNLRDKPYNYDKNHISINSYKLVQEKEKMIDDLNMKIKNLEKAKDESTFKNLSADELFREEFKNTKEELEKLKEKFVKKYNYLKEKYYIIKHQNKEKDGIIHVII